MSNVWVPNGAQIADKICVVSEYYYGRSHKPQTGEPHNVKFSHNIQNPPSDTIAVINNNLRGPFVVEEIRQHKSNFYTYLLIENAIPSNNMEIILKTDLKYWSLNELFLSGLIEKGGKIKEGTEFVVVTYSCHSTVIIKGGELYNKILGK